MALDVGYTNGVIAAREKYLLKEKITRLCELSAEEAFRALLESGFGGGAETATSVYEYEKLIAAEEEKIDAFIREYAPSEAEKAYLLSARDFHNAKALVKAKFLGTDIERMLAPEGMVSIALISACLESGNYAELEAVNSHLAGACTRSTQILAEDPSGFKVGEIFEQALYEYLFSVAKSKRVLKALLTAKADMTNILTAIRCADAESAATHYLPIGSLKEEQLNALFDSEEKAEETFKKTPYVDFVQLCLQAKAKGLPATQAERLRDGYDAAYFSQRKYELEKNEPFLYYVYRRRLENANVRIVFVCLLAGLSEGDVKKRLRTV